ncbi:MAG: hypothetical protein Q4C26_04190 [Bacteroidales bacterium]|nr:hypothetical protein [Bacteroidales bacterium]
MDYVRELAKNNNKSLNDNELRFHSLSCFQNKVVCRIVAFEKLPNEEIIYYGIDAEGVIYFGPVSEWESLFYNYDLMLSFAQENRSITYNKAYVKMKIIKFLSKEMNACCGMIE